MTGRYSVLWTNSAVQDLDEIALYIARDAPLVALELIEAIQDKTDKLYEMPERGRYVPELQEQGILLYRELIIPRWRVLYRVVDQTVYVLAVIDSRRKVEEILLEKLLR